MCAPRDSEPGSATGRPWGLWAAHATAVVLTQSTATAIVFILPVLARREFGAGKWETTLVTAAPLIFATAAIFWHAVAERLRRPAFVLLYWVAGLLPLGLIALAQSYTLLAVLCVISAIGTAGWAPIAGDMLRRWYPDEVRSKAYAVIITLTNLFGALGSFAVGRALEADASAFRIYMPLAAVIQLVGCGILMWLDRSHRPEPRLASTGRLAIALDPILHMGRILKADKVFARYEAAFMSYGVGWMICWALVPLLVTDKLDLRYDQVAASTSVAFLIASLLMTPLAGVAVVKLGPVRTCAGAFGLFALYPAGLMLAGNAPELAAASVLHGVSAAMVNMGWMLGPVALAPTPQKAPQYVAIHATLVGVRGILFQFLGVVLYEVTGRFEPAFIVALLGFAWASWQMFSLQRLMRATGHPAAR